MQTAASRILLILVISLASFGDSSQALSPGGAGSAAPNLGELLVHVVNPITGTPFLPGNFPLPGQKALTLEIAAARGEFEPASFVLRAPSRDVTGLTLSPTDLYGSVGSTVIPSVDVDIKIVKPWFQSYYAWNELGKSSPTDFRQKLVPELLLKDDDLVTVDLNGGRNLLKLQRSGQPSYEWINQKTLAPTGQALPTTQEFPVKDAKTLQPFSIPRSSGKQVWVTVYVPPTITPDEYTGDIVVRSNGALLGNIKIVVKVHNFELAQSSIVHSIYYRARLDNAKATVGSELRNTEQLRAEFQNMFNHGIRNPTMYQPLVPQEALREVLHLRQQFGMNTGPLYYLGIQTTATFLGHEPAEAEKQLRNAFSQISGLAGAYGFRSVYVYGKDEARGEELVSQRRLWDIVHASGGKVLVAGYTGSFELVGDRLDTLIHANQPASTEAQKWHGSGHQIFNYSNPQTGPENPFLFRLNYGVLLWANGYDGAMPYAYQHCFGSCWNDMDHPIFRDHNLTYPTADGAIDTLAWEGYREAVDDVRYLTTLEKMLNNASSGTADQARSFLSSLRASIQFKQAQAGKYNQRMDINLDALREQVVAYIQAMQ